MTSDQFLCQVNRKNYIGQVKMKVILARKFVELRFGRLDTKQTGQKRMVELEKLQNWIQSGLERQDTKQIGQERMVELEKLQNWIQSGQETKQTGQERMVELEKLQKFGSLRVIGIGTTSCSPSKLDWATWVTESSSVVQLSRKFSGVTLGQLHLMVESRDLLASRAASVCSYKDKAGQWTSISQVQAIRSGKLKFQFPTSSYKVTTCFQ